MRMEVERAAMSTGEEEGGRGGTCCWQSRVQQCHARACSTGAGDITPVLSSDKAERRRECSGRGGTHQVHPAPSMHVAPCHNRVTYNKEYCAMQLSIFLPSLQPAMLVDQERRPVPKIECIAEVI